jgi:hypothetical protein
VDDDLVPLARGPGVELMMQGGLGKQRQRVSLLLGQRRRFRGNVHRARASASAAPASFLRAR